jgi:hypothetical protein
MPELIRNQFVLNAPTCLDCGCNCHGNHAQNGPTINLADLSEDVMPLPEPMVERNTVGWSHDAGIVYTASDELGPLGPPVINWQAWAHNDKKKSSPSFDNRERQAPEDEDDPSLDATYGDVPNRQWTPKQFQDFTMTQDELTRENQRRTFLAQLIGDEDTEPMPTRSLDEIARDSVMWRAPGGRGAPGGRNYIPGT